MKFLQAGLIVLLLSTSAAGLLLAYREHAALNRLRQRIDDPVAGLQKKDDDAIRLIASLQAQLEIAQRSAPRGSPQLQAPAALQEKGMIDQRCVALFKYLTQNLDVRPQQIERLKDLMIQRRQAAVDARQVAQQKGINRQAYDQAVAEAIGEVDTQIREALGDAAYSVYQQYREGLPEPSRDNDRR